MVAVYKQIQSPQPPIVSEPDLRKIGNDGVVRGANFAPFFGLSLWTEFKLANCACASGWSCLMNLDLRSKFRVTKGHLSVCRGRVAGLVLSRKSYVHCEVEVHTVYQRLFKKADKGLHPMQHIPTYFACLS